jgi:very-short-patch-repair endonuclease
MPGVEPLELPGRLGRLAVAQGGVFTREQAVRAGLGRDEIERQRRAGHLVAVRRSVYATATEVADTADDPLAEHRRAASARRLVTGRDVTISHTSAAWLHGYRLLTGPPARPTLTVARAPGSQPLHLHGVHTAALPAQDRHLLLPKVPLTSQARTVADCCRVLGRDAALVVADSALGRGVSREDVLAVLERCVRWPGVVAAADVVRFADGRAESVLESLARQWFLEQGLPAPELQLEICHGTTGEYVACVDFVWLEQRTVCEVDGRLKYAVDADARPGDERRDPLFAEKRREDAVRDLGLEVVRGYWSDGADRGLRLAERLRRAFGRGAARTDRPRYGVLQPRPGRRRTG